MERVEALRQAKIIVEDLVFRDKNYVERIADAIEVISKKWSEDKVEAMKLIDKIHVCATKSIDTMAACKSIANFSERAKEILQ